MYSSSEKKAPRMNNTSVVHVSKEILFGSSTNVPSKTEGMVWCSIFSLLSVFTVVGNLLAIVLFVVNKRLRKKSLFLVINMAFADLMLGALLIPLFIYIRLGIDFYKLWTRNVNLSLTYFYETVYFISLAASLLCATFISCERFYAIYRPFKHRTLTVRTYRIVIFTLWTLAALNSSLGILIPLKLQVHSRFSSGLILIIIICGCNIAIWRKFQHGNIASQQQNRNLQNERLTKTLLFVSILALLCWLPVIIVLNLNDLGVSIPWRWFVIAIFLNYSNAFVNPVVYALRIPEFRQALAQCCVIRRAEVNTQNIHIRNNGASALTPATQLRTLQTDSNQFEEKVLDTKL